MYNYSGRDYEILPHILISDIKVFCWKELLNKSYSHIINDIQSSTSQLPQVDTYIVPSKKFLFDIFLIEG